MGILDNPIVKGLVDKAKNTAAAVKTGNQETEGLGNELAAKSDMIKAARGETNEPAPKAPVKREPSTWEKVHPMPYGSRPGEKRIDVTDALKPLGSYKKGTPYVPKTGVYKLHEGEAVVPKEKNTMNAADAMAGITGKAKPPKEIKEMVHTKTHNNKHIVTHRHHHPEHHPDETHAFDNMSDVHSHMEDHAGVPNAGEAAPTGAEAPSPLTAAPSPAPTPTPTPGM
jgi:hypothetical protein